MDRDRDRESITERTSANDEGSFRLLVDGVEDCGVILLDPLGRILTWNPGAERLTGYSAEEVLGRSVAVLHPPEPGETGEMPGELATASAEGNVREQAWRVRKDASRFWAEMTVTALRGPDGELRGFAHITRDLTEPARRRA